MTIDAGDISREIMAVLESDLRVSPAATWFDLHKEAMAALDSLGRPDQMVMVESERTDPTLFVVQVMGPRVRGVLSIRKSSKPR